MVKCARLWQWLCYGDDRKKTGPSDLQSWHIRSPIDHDSPFRKFWDSIISLLLMYLCATLPFLLAYSPNMPAHMKTIEDLIDGFFVLDIPLNFLSTTETDKGTIDQPFEVGKIYLMSGWFFVDLVSVFPPEWLGDGRKYGFIKAIKLLRVTKLKKLLPQIQTHFEIKNSHLSIVKFTIMILVTAHWCGSFFYTVAGWQGYPETSWMNIYLNGTAASLSMSPIRKFMCSFYWAITMMSTIGFGDVVPGTTYEIVYCIASMCVGTAIFAYSVTNMCSVVFGMDVEGGRFAGMQDRMKHLLERQGIGTNLKKKIRKYLLYKFHCSTVAMFGAFDVLDNLSTGLKEEVLKEFCDTLFKWVNIIHMFGPRFVRLIAFHLEGQVYNNGEVVMLAGTYCNRIYILATGKVEILYDMKVTNELEPTDEAQFEYPQSPENNVLKKIGRKLVNKGSSKSGDSDSTNPWSYIKEITAQQMILKAGCSWNEVSCLLAKPSTLTVYSVKYADIYSFTRGKYLDLVAEHFPNQTEPLFKKLLDHANKIGNLDFSLNLQEGEEENASDVSEEPQVRVFTKKDTKAIKMETLQRNMLLQLSVKERSWEMEDVPNTTFDEAWFGTEGFPTVSVALSRKQPNDCEPPANYKNRSVSDILLGFGSGYSGEEVERAINLLHEKIDSLQSTVSKDNEVLADMINNFTVIEDASGQLLLSPKTTFHEIKT